MSKLQKLKERDLHNKLLMYGYFPNKLENLLSSQEFGNYIIKKKLLPQLDKNDRFGFVTFKATNNNNTKRFFSIPHPIAYINLCNIVKSDWKKIKANLLSVKNYENISLITAKPNNNNGRIVSMESYDKNEDENSIIISNLVGSEYIVYTDISNFFPSIYTHSIPWVYVGKSIAKDKREWKEWFNKLDITQQKCQNGETNGVPIGPDTSNLIGELILSAVDKKLEHYKYIRHIDDYKCYCKSKEEAEMFINDLSTFLEEYRLKINSRKTIIKQLPDTLNEPWVQELRSFNFDKDTDDKVYFNRTNVNKALDFIDLSIKLLSQYPDKSTIKYATQVIWKANYEDYYSYKLILNRLAGICLIYPYFIDLLEEMFKKGFQYSGEELNHRQDILEIVTSIVNAHKNYNCPDVLAYCLYLLVLNDIKLKKWKIVENEFLEKDDCILNLYSFIYSKVNCYTINHYLKLLKKEKYNDEQWLFLYELSRIEKTAITSFITNNLRIDFFNELLNKDISFLNKKIKRKL